LRIAPLYAQTPFFDREQARRDVQTIEVCGLLAMLFSSQPEAAFATIAEVAAGYEFARAKFQVPNIAQNTGSCALDAVRACARFPVLIYESDVIRALLAYNDASSHSKEIRTETAEALLRDLQALEGPLYRESAGENRPVPIAYFQGLLWGTGPPEDYPQSWRPVFAEWTDALDRLQLPGYAERYLRFCRGEEIQWENTIALIIKWAEDFGDVKAREASDRLRAKIGPPPPGMPPPPSPWGAPPEARSLSDEPLTDDQGDRLDFNDYADALTALINNPKTKTPLTIAINAPWGAGKSTLAKMIQRRLTAMSAEGSTRPHVICEFNAWQHDDASNLASAFAAMIVRTANERRGLWRRLRDPLPPALQTRESRQRLYLWGFLVCLVLLVLIAPLITRVFTAFPELLLIIPQTWKPEAFAPATGTGLTVFFLFVIFKAVFSILPAANTLAEFVTAPESPAGSASMKEVSEQLKDLIQQATRYGNRFVIFVDDVERCRPPRSVDVLEVINQLLSHPGVVTVIMADMPAVAACAAIKYRRLAEKYTPTGIPSADTGGLAYGRAYLQKIVQAQFDLPPHRPDSIHLLIQELVKEGPAPPPPVDETAQPEPRRWSDWTSNIRNVLGYNILEAESWATLRRFSWPWFRLFHRRYLDFGIPRYMSWMRNRTRFSSRWRQGFSFERDIIRAKARRPRFLMPIRVLLRLIAYLPRKIAIATDARIYPRRGNWIEFWPQAVWRRYSRSLDLLVYLYSLSLLASVASFPLVPFASGYSTWSSSFSLQNIPLMGAYLREPWFLFGFQLSGVAICSVGIWMVAWWRSARQQAFDQTVKRGITDLTKRRPGQGGLSVEGTQQRVAQAYGVNVDPRIVESQIALYVADESELRAEAESEVMRFLPPLPRNAKRMMNRLRLMLVIAYQRGLFGPVSSVTPRHIGKWAVMWERWPELAQKLLEEQREMEALEHDAGNRAEFEARVRRLSPADAGEEDLRDFFLQSVKLGPVVDRIVYFQ